MNCCIRLKGESCTKPTPTKRPGRPEVKPLNGEISKSVPIAVVAHETACAINLVLEDHFLLLEKP